MPRALKKGLNNQLVNGAAEIQRAAAILHVYGIDATIEKVGVRLGAKTADALMRIGHGENEALLIVELKHRPTEATIAPTLAAADRDKTLVVADFIAPAVADKLRERRLAYVDLAGNAWLKKPGYFVWVQGQRPTAVKKRVARAFTPGGLQVILGLLTNPAWAQLPTRTLATMTGVANGTAAAALRELEELGFIAGRRAGKRRFRNREVLLNKWTEGYLQRLQQATLIKRFEAGTDVADWWKHLGEDKALLGGEPAAAMITGYLTPELITIYVDENPARIILKNKLHEAPEGKVLLRRKFWKFDAPGWTERGLAPPALIYADLLATNDARCIEAANRIKEQHLARLLED
jgi:hypothetical protein